MLPGHTPPRPLLLTGVSSAGVYTGNRESVGFFDTFQMFPGLLYFPGGDWNLSLVHMVEDIIVVSFHHHSKFGDNGLAQGGIELQLHPIPGSDCHVMPAGQKERTVRERGRQYEIRVDARAHDNYTGVKLTNVLFRRKIYVPKVNI